MHFLTLTFALAGFTLSQALTVPNQATCPEPRVRTEWRDLPDVQKTAKMDAVKCLAKLPHGGDLKPTGVTPNMPPVNPNSSRYDDFVYVHGDTSERNHFTGTFLAWHRWYLHTFEQELTVKCGYKFPLPFWDWSKDAKAGLPKSPIFDSNSATGLGTFGTSSNNFTVTNGGLANFEITYPFRHRLQRNYTRFPFASDSEDPNPTLAAEDTFTPEMVRAVVESTPGNYTAMAYLVEGVRAHGMHGAVHFGVGGDLGPVLWSPNEPIFWLHHANVDCIWARWQARDPASQYAFEGGATADLKNFDRHPVGTGPAVTLQTELLTGGLSPSVKVMDMMDTGNKQLCYKCAY